MLDYFSMWNCFYGALEVSDTDVTRKHKEIFYPTVHTWVILQSI